MLIVQVVFFLIRVSRCERGHEVDLAMLYHGHGATDSDNSINVNPYRLVRGRFISLQFQDCFDQTGDRVNFRFHGHFQATLHQGLARDRADTYEL